MKNIGRITTSKASTCKERKKSGQKKGPTPAKNAGAMGWVGVGNRTNKEGPHKQSNQMQGEKTGRTRGRTETERERRRERKSESE